jgi:hypothetical protein
MYKNIPTTCFSPLYLGHHQVGYNCLRGTILQYNITIIVSVSGEDEILFAKNVGVCVVLDTCIG